jgi:hypothetical protein
MRIVRQLLLWGGFVSLGSRLVIHGGKSLVEFRRGTVGAPREADLVQRESCDSMIDFLNEGRISGKCQLKLVQQNGGAILAMAGRLGRQLVRSLVSTSCFLPKPRARYREGRMKQIGNGEGERSWNIQSGYVRII